MADRKSIRELTQTEQDDFIAAVLALKSEFNFADGLSTYNRYVLWHQLAMFQSTPYGNDVPETRRNFAHRGPAFLPWHREFLYRFEKDLQRVSGTPDMGLPYWDWEVDGEKPQVEQPNQPIWSLVGGTGTPVPVPGGNVFIVESGPFGTPLADLSNPDTFHPSNPLLTLTVDSAMVNGQVRVSMARSLLMRNLGGGTIATLPTTADVNTALSIPSYDVIPWHEGSDLSLSFRNALEGWWPGWPNPPAPGTTVGLHNQVHVWVGGSMGPGTSPNDPVFFLHHANVDRIWSKWAPSTGNEPYVPMQGGPYGHTANDPMYPWDGRSLPEAVTVLQGADPRDTVYVEPATA